MTHDRAATTCAKERRPGLSTQGTKGVGATPRGEGDVDDDEVAGGEGVEGDGEAARGGEHEGDAIGGDEALGLLQRNRSLWPRLAHEKEPCNLGPHALGRSAITRVITAPATARPETAGDDAGTVDDAGTGDDDAIAKNCPRTGGGVTRRGGTGPRQIPALGLRATWNPDGKEEDENEAAVSRPTAAAGAEAEHPTSAPTLHT